MTRTRLLVLALLVILSGALCLTPARAEPGGGFAIVYSFSGEVLRPAVSYSLPLTNAPNVPVTADGLVLSDGQYGLGLATPLPTLTDPLFGWCGVKPSEGFTNILNACNVGFAVLAQQTLDKWDGGPYLRVTAFSF